MVKFRQVQSSGVQNRRKCDNGKADDKRNNRVLMPMMARRNRRRRRESGRRPRSGRRDVTECRVHNNASVARSLETRGKIEGWARPTTRGIRALPVGADERGK
jgi:hypothetical protein